MPIANDPIDDPSSSQRDRRGRRYESSEPAISRGRPMK